VIPYQDDGEGAGIFSTGVVDQSASDAWLVGASSYGGGPGYMYGTNALSEHWDGSAWSLVDLSPAPAGTATWMSGVDADAGTVTMAGGLLAPVGQFRFVPLVYQGACG
jgi:hypothetical protein